MVILDYEHSEHNYVASTPKGLQELLFFQGHFYRCDRKFQHLNDAIHGCRRDMDYCSVFRIVVQHPDHSEVWLRIADDVFNITQIDTNGGSRSKLSQPWGSYTASPAQLSLRFAS
ncbi:MAG: hypothetical protein HC818_01495 [Synechococcaceae cyanobacterium RM1_1_27]|nr:hypothetical protein [Synechococcaceae cyanobacterium SM2_3_2]NJO85515.1 hypothetical protein [Synechococcaceae cyanobacterium RM1_1_27]